MSNPEKMEEAQPSSGSTSEQEQILTTKGKLSTHFSSTVDTRAGYIPLLILCFVTGLTDGTLYNGEKSSFPRESKNYGANSFRSIRHLRLHANG